MTSIDPVSPDRTERSRSTPPGQSGHPDPEAGVRAPKRLRNAIPSDQVSVSSDARLASKIHDAIHGAPDVRESLVQEIKAAVDSGSYRVDPREIAQAMLKPSDDNKKRVEG